MTAFLSVVGVLLITPALIALLYWGEWAATKRAWKEYAVVMGVLLVPGLLVGGMLALLSRMT